MGFFAIAGIYIVIGLVAGTLCYALDYFFGDGLVTESSYIRGESFGHDFYGVLFLGPLAAPLCVLVFFVTIISAIRFAYKNHWKSPWALRKEYRESLLVKPMNETGNYTDKELPNRSYRLELGEQWTRRAEGL